MLLWAVKPHFLVRQEAVDLSDDVALEAAHRLFLGQAVLGAAIDLLGGARVIDHAGDHDVPQGRVGLAIAAAVEPVPFLLTAARFDR